MNRRNFRDPFQKGGVGEGESWHIRCPRKCIEHIPEPLLHTWYFKIWTTLIFKLLSSQNDHSAHSVLCDDRSIVESKIVSILECEMKFCHLPGNVGVIVLEKIWNNSCLNLFYKSLKMSLRCSKEMIYKMARQNSVPAKHFIVLVGKHENKKKGGKRSNITCLNGSRCLVLGKPRFQSTWSNQYENACSGRSHVRWSSNTNLYADATRFVPTIRELG